MEESNKQELEEVVSLESVATDQQPAIEAEANTPEVGDTAAAPESTPVAASGREEAQQFHEAYGIDGLLWYAEGKTFAEAGVAYVAALKAENEALASRLASISQGESEPVEFAPESSERSNRKPKGLAGAIRLPGSN